MDGNGCITKTEVQKILKQDNVNLKEEIVEYLVQQVDSDNDGKINFEEFIKMLQIESGTNPKLQSLSEEFLQL